MAREDVITAAASEFAARGYHATSIEHLLADGDRLHGSSGLYNALHESALTFERARIDGDTVTVHLSGELKSGGSCDDPRIEWQLRQTAATAAGVA